MALNMQALLKIRADVQGEGAVQSLATKLGGLNRTAGTVRQGFGSLGNAAVGLGSALSGLAVGGALKGVMATFGEYQADIKVLENGLKNLGGNAPQYLEPLKKIASDLGELTLFNESDFNKGFGLLTSFGNIGVSSYERVAKAAADVAQTSGTDVSAAMMQLAKALNDPAKGLTALARSGIQFTEAQKTMIESMVDSGNIAGAQELIFKELEKQYGGNAAAAATGYAGALDTLGEKFYDLQKAAGPLIEAGLTPLIQALTKTLEILSTTLLPAINALPGPIKTIIGLVGVLTAALLVLLPALGLIAPGLIQLGTVIGGLQLGATIGGWLGAVGPAIAGITAAFAGLMAWITGTLLPFLVGVFSGPVGWTILAVAAVVAMCIAFREPIMKFFSWLGGAIGEGLTALWEWGEPIRKFWVDAFGVVANIVKTSLETIGGILKWAFDAWYAITYQIWVQPWINLWNNVLREPVTKMGEWIKGVWNGIVAFFSANVIKPIQGAWDALMQALPKAMDNLGKTVKGVWDGIVNTVKQAIRGMLQNIANNINVVGRLVNRLIGAFNRLPGPDIPFVPTLTVPAFAEGGIVKRPTLAMVGEGGEPEYIIPESKMAAASANYMAGARGSAVITPAGRTGSAAAPAISIQTGPVVEFNGERYVTLADLERGLQQMASSVYQGLRTPAGRYAMGIR